MPRNMLIVHEDPLLRKIVRNYALAELSDVVVETAASDQEGWNLLRDKKYDVIIRALESETEAGRMSDAGGRPEKNKATPVVVMTPTLTQEQRESLGQQGIRHFLFAPYGRGDLASVVDEACNPRQKRAYQRYSIQGAQAVLHADSGDVVGDIINISMNGILIEADCTDDPAWCLRPCVLDVRFPVEYGRALAEGIVTKILRFQVMSWGDDLKPLKVRLARVFSEVPESTWTTLEMILERAGQERLVGRASTAGGMVRPL